MSDTPMTAFGKFVPGFDFLQNIAKGASQAMPQMPTLASWVAPTLNVEELEKRIGELKAVHFWLEQNSNALAATIQALEVQKMTLATLKGMNFSMGELASAMQLKPAEPAADNAAPAQHAADASPAQSADGKRKAGATAQPAGGVVDPMQWWGALTQQFQQIAADAMKDTAQHTGVDAVSNMATGMTRDAMKAATSVMTSATPGSGAKPARKAASKVRKARKPPAAGKGVARKTSSR